MSNSSSIELNHKIHKLIQISSQESLLLKSVEKFYENLKCFNDFIQIINSQTKIISKSKISIRLIDYFVTKYSKKNKVSYKINDNKNNDNKNNDNKNIVSFSVYQSYKQQLKAFQKKNFDPFARGIRIPYFINNTFIITTIGQLNFFMWFISKNIIDYVIKNKEIIEIDMNKTKKNKIIPKIKKSFKIYKKIEMNHIPINNKINNSKNVNKILVTF
jgi:hypothetical protein